MKKTTRKRITPAADRIGRDISDTEDVKKALRSDLEADEPTSAQASGNAVPGSSSVGQGDARKTDESHRFLHDLYTNIKKEDWKKFEQKPVPPRRKKIWWAIGGFFLLAAFLTLAGFFVFNQEIDFSGQDVVLSIDAPERAASGDTMVWTVKLANNGTVDLTDIEINVRQPSGWKFITATPKSETEFGNTWKLNRLSAHNEHDIVITASLIGDVGSEKRLEATASYVPANFSSTFETTASALTRLTESNLSVSIDAPHNATRGQEVSYVIAIKNTDDEGVESLHVEIRPPEELKDVQYDPQPNAALAWDERELKSGEEWKIRISGKLDAEPGVLTELNVRVGVLDADASFVVQREKSALVLILDAAVNIGLSSGDSTSGIPASSGGTVPVTIDYSNDSDSVIEGVAIELSVSGKDSDGKPVNLVDLGEVKSDPQEGKIEGATIFWTKDDVEAFGRMTPGSKGKITVEIPVKTNVRSEGSGTNLTILVDAFLTMENVGGTGSQGRAEAEGLAFPITTELRLSTEGRYYDSNGNPVGSGPMPPEVDKETRYKISWFVTNTMNGVKDAVISAKLAEGVTFVDAEKTGGNNISFDIATREIRWRIPKIDAKVGHTLPTLSGTFTVSIMPTDAQAGNIVSLLGTTTMHAVDIFTNAELSQTTDPITSELPGDDYAEGKGRVVKPEEEDSNTNE